MDHLSRVLAVLLGTALGAMGVWLFLRPTAPETPDTPSVVERMREVARLETLEVSLYKKVTFSPEPHTSDALWKDVVNWARYTIHTPRGRAIIFADAHLGFDFERFGASNLQVSGSQAWVVLPPLDVKVVLRPGETEIIDSNLDSAQTAELLEKARLAFEREVRADERLQERARRSAEHSLRGLLLTLGYREVNFVDRLPGSNTTG